ncbi:type IV pilus modification protein PilV [Candidatus Thiothrix sp. Deng01]|uniref:Type IV pilus modification protein PilV n=1 Tax=Candidatus Thiothrix phosphatis TaxID=3112415 RepID=A0ABU6CZX4_9GAMM|nr:type IV pilus modification protein PilV [Candidatus Thiothrix sp. Deng01]MEB4592381.1 type IV pilus modification protein PilV [Candidatus Thiothrix sp. Deng01]
MPIRLQIPRKQAGLSLLEVLIATVVLSAGLLGLAGLQIASMKTTHNSYQMQQATWLVHDLLERMRSNKQELFRMTTGSGPVPASAYLLANPQTSSDYCGNGLAKNCSTDTDCTGVQVATYDLHNIMCGDGLGSGVNNVLMGGQLQVTCPTGDCHGGVQVNLQWNERNATKKGGDFDGDADGVEAFNIRLMATI